MAIRGYKSKDYLDFIGSQVCCITGKIHPDVHHEGLIRRFSGAMKKYFDYGALPLDHEVHLYERHGWGKHTFWEHYDKDPKELAVQYLTEYLETNPVDYIEAEEALEMVKNEQR